MPAPGPIHNVPLHHVLWRRSCRIIPTRYPEKNLYQHVADPADLPAIHRIERLTNLRVRLESGEAPPLRSGDHLPKGRWAYNVTTAFSHLSSSRFGDGAYPVYYAARALATAIRETCFHREQFMAATKQKAMILPMRVLVAQVRGRFHDLRKKKRAFHAEYSPTSYQASQRLGRRLWQENSSGVVYDSVRDSRGECIAVFSPQTIRYCRQERCLYYEWDGTSISRVYEIREFAR
ncbi:MAG TPA: RES family NAD+ phosphorylase [Elusimicrobiota bacterium]|nr:RES family NAD+ phosphorylase [Elusimicrobiota bacterium]